MKNEPTKSIHALVVYFSANLLLLFIDAPGWILALTTAVLLWWIVRWEGDGKENK